MELIGQMKRTIKKLKKEYPDVKPKIRFIDEPKGRSFFETAKNVINLDRGGDRDDAIHEFIHAKKHKEQGDQALRLALGKPLSNQKYQQYSHNVDFWIQFIQNGGEISPENKRRYNKQIKQAQSRIKQWS